MHVCHCVTHDSAKVWVVFACTHFLPGLACQPTVSVIMILGWSEQTRSADTWPTIRVIIWSLLMLQSCTSSLLGGCLHSILPSPPFLLWKPDRRGDRDPMSGVRGKAANSCKQSLATIWARICSCRHKLPSRSAKVLPAKSGWLQTSRRSATTWALSFNDPDSSPSSKLINTSQIKTYLNGLISCLHTTGAGGSENCTLCDAGKYSTGNGITWSCVSLCNR